MTKFLKSKVVSTKLEEISPTKARVLLNSNTVNRSLYPSVIKEYVRYMRNDQWIETGQSIILSVDGNLLDGQHRLTAMVEAGKTYMFNIVVLASMTSDVSLTAIGLPIDRQKPRSIADTLGIPKSHASIAIQFLSVFKHHSFAKDPLVVGAVVELLHDSIEAVTNVYHNAVGFSGTFIQMVFVLRHYQGHDNLVNYEHVLQGEYHLINARWSSWVHRVIEDSRLHSAVRKIDKISRVWILTRPNSKSTKGIKFYAKSMEKAGVELRDYCRLITTDIFLD